MSALALVASAASAVSGVLFHSHHHGGRGAKAATETVPAVGKPGQLPVGAGQSLMSNMVQSLQQTLAGQGAAAAGSASLGAISGTTTPSTAASTAVTGSSAPANVTQDVHAFMHDLFQALNASGSVAATPTSSNGPYQPGLVSSLQSLIQQVSAGGTSTPATANLTASFNQLKRDLGAEGGGAAGSAAAAPSASLQNLLSGFLQHLQGAGHVEPTLVGGNVNAQV